LNRQEEIEPPRRQDAKELPPFELELENKMLSWRFCLGVLRVFAVKQIPRGLWPRISCMRPGFGISADQILA